MFTAAKVVSVSKWPAYWLATQIRQYRILSIGFVLLELDDWTCAYLLFCIAAE